MNKNKKILIAFFLILFSSFLMTPIIITVVEKSSEVSCFYNLDDEKKEKDLSGDLKELKELPYTQEELFNFSQISTEKENHYYYNKRHYNQVIDIVIPPPEVI